MARPLEKANIRALAIKHGFAACGFTHARLDGTIGKSLSRFVATGLHGEMDWMQTTLARRLSPEKMWPQARTAIMLAMNYGPPGDPLAMLAQKDRGSISVYARNRDYHNIIKGRLKLIAQQIASRNSAEVKVFVDTAPLMEKPLARNAGLGWQGKHTNLVSREYGSWTFLGAILTDADIPTDEPGEDACGTCTACLDICPTGAFPAPYRLDARACISYLTIEHAGVIPHAYRKPIGNRIFGCDDCLAVCPWNKWAQAAAEPKLIARTDLEAPKLAELAGLDEAGFRKMFSGSPIKRIGIGRFLRNVLVAIGNSGEARLAPLAERRLKDADPLVRGAAVWAMAQLVDNRGFSALARRNMAKENDASVLAEWRMAQKAGK